MEADAWDEEIPVQVAAIVAGGASDPQRVGRSAENCRAVEQHVAIGDQGQVGLLDALFFKI